MKQQVFSDAIVTYEDAIKWVEPMIMGDREKIIEDACALEPAVVGVAVDMGRRTRLRLEREGVSPELIHYVFRQVTLVGAMTIELMHKGNAKLWDYLISPDSDEPIGDTHA